MLKNKVNKTIRSVLFVFLILTGCMIQHGCTEFFPGRTRTLPLEFITIGALLPLTGTDSDEGLRALNGLMLAKEEINESGGVLGMMLDIIVLNDKGDEEYIIQQYDLLKEKDVAAIIGSCYSNATAALAKAAERDGIPVISPSASDPDITAGRRNVFRAIFIDDYQADAAAYFAYNSLNARTAVVLKNENFSSFARAADVFSESFRNNGGQIIAVETFSGDAGIAGNAEFRRILGKYAGNTPDVLYCPEKFISAAALVNTAHELGFADTFLLGSAAWDGILSYVIHPGAMRNVFYSAHFSFDDPDEDAARFVRNYFRTFSQMPLSGSAAAYTCVYLLADAVRRAGKTDADDVISAMKESDLEAITGRINFDENNNPQPNIYFIQIKGGMYSAYQKFSLQPDGLPVGRR